MKTIRHPFALLILFAVVLGAAGCSDRYGGKMEVTGVVTLGPNKEPIMKGTIEFKPLDKQDTQGGAMIVNGEYKVPRQQGLKPGKYLILISSPDASTPANAPEDFTPGPSRNFTAVDKVPKDWNLKSKHEVEIKAEPPNKFDFDIPKYNPDYERKPKKQ